MEISKYLMEMERVQDCENQMKMIRHDHITVKLNPVLINEEYDRTHDDISE